MTESENELEKGRLANILRSLATIANLDSQEKTWGDQNAPPWQTFGETMASLFDDFRATDVLRMSAKELRLDEKTAAKFKRLIEGLDRFSSARVPNNEVNFDELRNDASWLALVREADDFLRETPVVYRMNYRSGKGIGGNTSP
jgi:hypothetical protein